MTILFMEGFDAYGNNTQAFLQGAWSEISLDDGIVGPGDQSYPTFGARTGTYCFHLSGTSSLQGNGIRRTLASTENVIHIAAAYATSANPEVWPFDIARVKDGNTTVGAIQVNSNLSFSVLDASGTVVATSSALQFAFNAWFHLEVMFDRANGHCQVRINGNTTPVIDYTAGNSTTFGATGFTAIEWDLEGTGSFSFWIDDVCVSNGTGTYNSGYLGDVRVATLRPNADTATAGWTAFPRQLYDLGIGYINSGTNGFVHDSTQNIGSGDFTIETWVHWRSLPTGTNEAMLLASWTDDEDERSWRLFKGGPSLNAGALVFEVSTDGTLGTVTQVIQWEHYEPRVGAWDHIAISRVSGVTYLFVNGIMQGVGTADANSYYADGAGISIGNTISTYNDSDPQDVLFTVDFTTDAADADLDETRITVGTGRYSANFAVPTAKFPRSVGEGDANFANVALLVGYDGSTLVDESSNAATLGRTVGAEITLLLPTDGGSAYLTTNAEDFQDDTFISADFPFADARLTLAANPTANDTVTVGTQTYTFVASLTTADDVLIGATADDSLDNLAAAINQSTGEGTLYGTGTVANTDASAESLGGQQMDATARTQGAAGNSIASTETFTDSGNVWDAATFTGGADIPGPSQFQYSDLPGDTTTVLGIMLINRCRKTDSGPASFQASLDVAGDLAAGTEHSLTDTSSYVVDVFEEDPDTVAQLTVNAVNNAQVRVNRTV